MKISEKKVNALCCLTMAALGLYLSAYQTALPSVAKEYNFAAWATGAAVSVHFIASFIFPTVLGYISDKTGRKRVLIISFALFILGMILMVYVKSSIAFLCGVFLAGGGVCVIEGSMSGLLSEINPGKELKIMNVSQMYFCIGCVIAPLASLLFDGWRSFYLFVLLSFVLCLILVLFVPLSGSNEKNASIKSLLSDKFYILILVSMLLYVGIEEGTAFWTDEFVSSKLSSSSVSAYFLSAYWLGMSVSRLIASFIKRKIILFSAVGIGIAVVGFCLLLFFAYPVTALTAFFFIGFGIAPLWPFIMAKATVSYPNMPDTAAGGVMSAGSIGAASVPFLLGLIASGAGITVSFFLLFAMLIALGLLMTAFIKKR